MKAYGPFPSCRLQAKALLRRYERFLLHLKAQTSYLIQKYTFFQFKQKLGFRLRYSSRRLDTLSLEEVTEGRFSTVVVTALREYMAITGLSGRRAAKIIGRALGVGASTIYHWMSADRHERN